MPLRRLSQAVDAALGLRPDMIALMGDYIADHLVARPPMHEDVAAELARLQAPCGVVAVTGNHDWYQDRQAQERGYGPVAIARTLAQAGIDVLENEARRLNMSSGQPIWLAGLSSQQITRHRGMYPAHGISGADDLDGTLMAVTDNAPVILLAHEPNIINRVPQRVSLTVSGHTHGGQINLPILRKIAARHLGTPHLWGHHVVKGRDLIVSGGMGCSGLPIRMGRKPELTMIEIGRYE